MIRAENLIKKFDDTVALGGISCTVPDGCIYGLVGSNGAGKSTFMRLAAGVYKADSGSITLDGQPIYENPGAKGKIAYVSDELFFPRSASLKRMAALYSAFYPNFSHGKFRHLAIEVFNLPFKKPVHTFSKGMKRQAATLLALCCGANYLFFDETFDGLDAVVRKLIRSLICEEVADRNATAIIASHSLRELEGTCDQLALLHKGGIVLESEVGGIETSKFKVQVAFQFEYGRELFDTLENTQIIQFSKLGSVSTVIASGDREDIARQLNEKNPGLLEILPLSLEELFIFEMNNLGYTFDPEIFRETI